MNGSIFRQQLDDLVRYYAVIFRCLQQIENTLIFFFSFSFFSTFNKCRASLFPSFVNLNLLSRLFIINLLLVS